MRLELSTGRVIDTSSLQSLRELDVPVEAVEALEALCVHFGPSELEAEARDVLLRVTARLLQDHWGIRPEASLTA